MRVLKTELPAHEREKCKNDVFELTKLKIRRLTEKLNYYL